jgi:hypothetical protein
MKNLPEISMWTYKDLLELPSEETDIYEYKSSRVTLDQLKNKISMAASAFGILVAVYLLLELTMKENLMVEYHAKTEDKVLGIGRITL